MLGTDRLHGMGGMPLAGITGDQFAAGFRKDHFGHIRTAGTGRGTGVDAFIILEERPDIRIIVEATLSHLFDRNISLEWDSGNLVPMAQLTRTADTYRVDRDECHGIRELLVLLTHLHNDANSYLIIDEPELNLHPPFQSFFMHEVRKVAGPPEPGKRSKGIFLITHSPFMIDLRTIEDLHSLFSFSADHSVPRFVADLEADASERISSFIPRLNVQHKQLFFSDNPIFVEGIFDSQIIEAIQMRRKVSVTGAGSCIIDVGGCEEVGKYVELCRHYQKSAYFLYDLDSLFTGNLRQCIRADETVGDFLGDDFGAYCGLLDRKLTEAIKKVRESDDASDDIEQLRSFIEELAENGELQAKELARARVAVLVALHECRDAIVPALTENLANDIEGRLNQIVGVLRERNVFVLPGGALEHYLPSYQGDRYSLSDSSKRGAVEAEVALLSSGEYDGALPERYGALFNNIAALPGKTPVDTDTVLLRYLGDYVHQLQGLVIAHPDWGMEQFNTHFSSSTAGLGRIFAVSQFERNGGVFSATIGIFEAESRIVRISHETNAGMQRFDIEHAGP